jgi:hypothetical protein
LLLELSQLSWILPRSCGYLPLKIDANLPKDLPEELVSLIHTKMGQKLNFQWVSYGGSGPSLTLVLKWKDSARIIPGKSHSPLTNAIASHSSGRRRKPPKRAARDKKRWEAYRLKKTGNVHVAETAHANVQDYAANSPVKTSTGIHAGVDSPTSLPTTSVQVNRSAQPVNTSTSRPGLRSLDISAPDVPKGGLDLDLPVSPTSGNTCTETADVVVKDTGSSILPLIRFHKEFDDYTRDLSEVDRHTTGTFYRQFKSVHNKSSITLDHVGMDEKYIMAVYKGHMIRYSLDDSMYCLCYFADKFPHWLDVFKLLDFPDPKVYNYDIDLLKHHFLDDFEDFNIDLDRESNV